MQLYEGIAAFVSKTKLQYLNKRINNVGQKEYPTALNLKVIP